MEKQKPSENFRISQPKPSESLGISPLMVKRKPFESLAISPLMVKPKPLENLGVSAVIEKQKPFESVGDLEVMDKPKETESVEVSPLKLVERTNRRALHNFVLPWPKWGARRTHRCMKREPAFEISSLLKKISGDGVERLVLDYEEEFCKLGNEIFNEGFEVGEDRRSRPCAAAAAVPWNLRKKRAAAAPEENNCGKAKQSVGVLKRKVSPAREDRTMSFGMEPKSKLSIALSRDEIEEDYFAITGQRLPRKSTKRPRIVQRKLDTIFPGLWLTEVNEDLYKVRLNPPQR